MQLKDVIKCLKTPHGMTYKEAMDMEVEFNTINRLGLQLLSVFEDDGKIIVDIGTKKDDEDRRQIATIGGVTLCIW